MKPVYKINRKKLKFPRECYTSWYDRLLGIRSPSRSVAVALGFFGEEARNKYHAARYENIRLTVNKRTATRDMWRSLYSWERRHSGWRGLDD